MEVLLDNVSVWGTLPASGHAKNGWLEAAERDTKGGYEAIWRGVVDEMRVLLKQARRGLEAGAIANDEKVLRDLGCFGQVKVRE